MPLWKVISSNKLLDDVYTTGSTLAECAKVLKKAGAKEVRAVALAINI